MSGLFENSEVPEKQSRYVMKGEVQLVSCSERMMGVTNQKLPCWFVTLGTGAEPKVVWFVVAVAHRRM